MDRRSGLRTFLTAGAALVAGLSASAAVTALTELVDLGSDQESWIGVVVGVFGIVTLILLSISDLRRVRRRRRPQRRGDGISDPQLLELLRELEVEQARFDRAMLEKSR